VHFRVWWFSIFAILDGTAAMSPLIHSVHDTRQMLRFVKIHDQNYKLKDSISPKGFLARRM
jgi:hypothetical protein